MHGATIKIEKMKMIPGSSQCLKFLACLFIKLDAARLLFVTAFETQHIKARHIDTTTVNTLPGAQCRQFVDEGFK
jgi:hypothetical protein